MSELSEKPTNIDRIKGLIIELVARGVFLFLGLLIGFIIVEGALRIFWPQQCPSPYYPRYMFTKDADTGYRLRPGFRGRMHCPEFDIDITINSDGLRDAANKQGGPDQITILGLGDSFGFGHGVPREQDVFSLLEQQSQNRFVTINGSVPGYNTRNELAWLKKYGVQYHPQLVLLAMHDNDWTDNLRDDVVTEHDGYLISASSVNDTLVLKKKPSRTLWAIKYIRRLQIGIPLARGVREIPFLYHFLVDRGLLSESRWDWRWFSPSAHSTPGMISKWARTLGFLQELNDYATSIGAKTVITVIPTAERIYDSMWERRKSALQRSGVDVNDIVPDYPEKVIAQCARDHGMTYIDLWHPLHDAATHEIQLYFSIDGHWNTNGHALAARVLNEFIMQMYKQDIPSSPADGP